MWKIPSCRVRSTKLLRLINAPVMPEPSTVLCNIHSFFNISSPDAGLRKNHRKKVQSINTPAVQAKLPASRKLTLSVRTPAKRFLVHNSSVNDMPQSAILDFPEEVSGSSAMLLRPFLAAVLNTYLDRNPTARRCLRLVEEAEGSRVPQDHFAFRTFGVDGWGIDSLAALLLPFGYVRKDLLFFPAKHLRAYWFAPPASDPYFDAAQFSGFQPATHALETTGHSAEKKAWFGPLPRIFVSELQVEALSERAQAVIAEHTQRAAPIRPETVALSAALGKLLWGTPTEESYDLLAEESEYAAWVLLHGYALNHTTVSAHSLSSTHFHPVATEASVRRIDRLNDFLLSHGVAFNTSGSLLKASPDGLLLQSSTLADSALFRFASGALRPVAASYIEFAERLPLPQFAGLREDELQEHHRRDGFEAGSADKIFESTAGRQ